jgi:hypothetical protein
MCDETNLCMPAPPEPGLQAVNPTWVVGSSAIVGANPAMSGRSDDSVTYAGATSATVTDAAPAMATTTSAPTAMPATTSPRQALVATLTATIASAHAAGDIATAQIAARTLAELLSVPQAPAHVAPVVAIATARRARR